MKHVNGILAVAVTMQNSLERKILLGPKSRRQKKSQDLTHEKPQVVAAN